MVLTTMVVMGYQKAMSLCKLLQNSTTIISRLKMETSPFTKVVVSAMRKLYPEELADRSFDNTGLLVEAPWRANHTKNSVLLSVDLTSAVADEAISRKDSVVIAYHPIIFRPLKSLSLGNTQQASLLRLVQEGISVYSPHTAVDAASGGLNDWLADIVTGKETESEPSISHRSIIRTITNAPPGFEDSGYGRIVRFSKPVTLKVILRRITKGLEVNNGLSVAVPQAISNESKSEISISSIGICAGSGGSMLNGLDVDLLFTGELSHHETLAAIESGIAVVTAGHSNTERGFLKSRLRQLLLHEIRQEITQSSLAINSLDLDLEDSTVVDVSQIDRDPFEIVRLQDKFWL